MRLALIAALITSLCASAVSADEISDFEVGKKQMLAAAVVLSTASQHFGELVIDSSDHAHYANGSAQFEKISECKYSQYHPIGTESDWYEIIDFRALTGDYQRGSTLAGNFITLQGSSPRTRCFRISGGDFCSAIIKMYVSPREESRVIDDLKYLFEACPEDRRDPY